MHKTLVLVGMVLATLAWSCGKQVVLTLPASDPIPVHAWWSIPSDSTSVERYKELAEAGFTSSMSPFRDAEAAQKALDAANEAGIKLFITCPELRTAPDSTVKRFMNHPALGGYHLTDEPNAAAFPDLAEWVKQIQKVDSTHPCYINLFPNYATPQQLGTPTYQAHVDSFIAIVPVPMISYDHYPVTTSGLRPEYYENLEIISAAARNAGKPFWAFTLSVAHGPYPIPTTAELRLQVYSDLAYGAQGIEYFTYWTPADPNWNFHDAPIDSAGARTPVYDRVKEVNAEIQKVSGVFIGSNVVSIGHTGENLPLGTQAFEPFPPFKAVETPNGGAVVSRLEKDDATFLVMVNRDYQNAMNLDIMLDSGALVGQVGKDGSVNPVEGNRIQTQVAPGDAVIFMTKGGQ